MPLRQHGQTTTFDLSGEQRADRDVSEFFGPAQSIFAGC